MLAHRFLIGPGNHVQEVPAYRLLYHRLRDSYIISTTIIAYGADMTAIWRVIFA